MDLYEELLRDERSRERGSRNAGKKTRASRLDRVLQQERQFGDFKCIHCRLAVSADAALSGVQNRNHCPYCLWSKHVDLHQSGDRLAACKGKMRPAALALKHSRNKYGRGQHGELMLVHACQSCGAVSANRIAADDFAPAVWAVYQASLNLPPGLVARMNQDGIQPLDAAAATLVQSRLFGRACAPPSAIPLLAGASAE